MTDDIDVRARPPEWSQIVDLVDGARQRGFTETQLDYLTAVVGVTWAKAQLHGERVAREVSP